jgi:hypothetical protein
VNKSSSEILQNAINFAARFGFLTKEIFFENLCLNQTTQQYYHWNKLVTGGHFFKSQKQHGLIYLAAKGRKLATVSVAPNKSLYILNHDILVAKIFLRLERTGKLLNAWTEFELSKDQYQTCILLGVNRIDKLPDLLVDLHGANKTIRIAIEIENTLKAKDRYLRISQGYLSMRNVNLLIYGCSSLVIQATVARTFSGAEFVRSQKAPITFLNSEFSKDDFSAEGSLLNRRMPLKKMLSAALETPEDTWEKKPKKNRKPFRENILENNFEKQSFSKADQELTPPAQAPAPWQSLRDHPHPTMLIEGGHEPGAGVGRGPDLTEEEELKE